MSRPDKQVQVIALGVGGEHKRCVEGGGEQWKFPRAAHLSKTAAVITVIESPLITRRLLL